MWRMRRGCLADQARGQPDNLGRYLRSCRLANVAGMRTTELAVTRDIAASPEAVYAAVADVTRMGEWSPECHTCAWVGDATEAAVGAQFLGSNANNGAEWEITNTVTAADAGQRFAFDCSMRDFTFASWGYNIEATESGCRVTETWKDHRTDEMASRPSISGVADRAEFNRQSMETTLERIAGAVEG